MLASSQFKLQTTKSRLFTSEFYCFGLSGPLCGNGNLPPPSHHKTLIRKRAQRTCSFQPSTFFSLPDFEFKKDANKKKKKIKNKKEIPLILRGEPRGTICHQSRQRKSSAAPTGTLLTRSVSTMCLQSSTRICLPRSPKPWAKSASTAKSSPCSSRLLYSEFLVLA